MVHITGRISPVLRLSLGNAWQLPHGASARVEASAPDFAQIGLSGNADKDPSQITVPLELRTNVGYELRLSLLASDGCSSDFRASIGSVLAGGSSVVAGAAEGSRSISDITLARLNSPMVMLVGPRISARGSLTSPNNALQVNLNITVSTREQTEQTMCSWHASLRISLQSGSSF
jgi:hypothetical protein